MKTTRLARFAALVSLSAVSTACSDQPPTATRRMAVLDPVDVPGSRAFECAPTPAGAAESIGVFADGRDVLSVFASDGCRGTVAVPGPMGTAVSILPEAFYLAAAGAKVGGLDVVCATRATATQIMVPVSGEDGTPMDHPAKGSTGYLYRIDGTEVVCRAQAGDGTWGASQIVAVPTGAPAGTAIAQWVSGVEDHDGPAVVVFIDSLFDPGKLTTSGRPAYDGFWRVGLTRGGDGALAVGAGELVSRPDLRQFACSRDVTCEELGVACGDTIGPCGETKHCGGCDGGEVCGGGGEPGQCGEGTCTPQTCADLGAACGDISDGCGGILACGDCEPGAECGAGGEPNQCACVPRSCEVQSKNCGAIDDGCGGILVCGSCAGDGLPAGEGEEQPPGTCGGGGVNNVCGALY